MAIQQAHLLAADGATVDYFGRSVTIDGDTLVVGADGDTVGSTEAQGSAYVFTRSGTTWSQQAKLVASDGGTTEAFGCAVAVSGYTVVVGADEQHASQGSAYVFTRSGTVWSQEAKLSAVDGRIGDYFGHSVAFEGDTAVVGSFNQGSSQGCVYVFTRSGSVWSQQTKLTAADGGSGDYFGWSLALSADTVVVCAPSDDVGSNADQGSAYVFALTSVPAPSISQLNPTRALLGATVTMGGSGFGASQGTSTVTFGGIVAAVGSWSDTAIVCTVPAGLRTGVVDVIVHTVVDSNAVSFLVVVRPSISTITPARGRVGITVTIVGKHFGARRGTSKVIFGTTAATKYVSWSATRIKVRVPGITRGRKAVRVVTAVGRGNAKYFTRR